MTLRGPAPDASHPGAEEVSLWTDRYFLKTK